MRRPQCERLLDYLRDNNGITSLEASWHLGITQLSARIIDLEARGYRFVREREKLASGARVVRYRLPAMGVE